MEDPYILDFGLLILLISILKILESVFNYRANNY